MRRYLLGLLLPVFMGCSGQNVVAGEEKSKAEQLAASVPSWCESTCGRFLACSEQKPCDCSGDVCDCLGVDQNCPTQCKASMAAYMNAGEACAVIGERFKKCIDRATCDDLGQNNPCPISAAERAACPDPNYSDEPPQVGSTYAYAGSANIGDDSGASYGGAVSYAGSASYGGSASVPTGGTSYGGSASTGGPTVTCGDSYGAGGGQPSDGSSQVICEEGRDSCSDGHAYSWVCAADSQGRRACSCFVDSQVTGAFAPGASCPLPAQVNAGCGWNLAQ
jgi:hypothetical protein